MNENANSKLKSYICILQRVILDGSFELKLHAFLLTSPLKWLFFLFQKVFYSMYSTMDNKIYYSTVRGCAWNCLPKNDFKNCSSELHGSRGCVTRNCCRDNDLCNKGTSVVSSSQLSFLLILFIISCFATLNYWSQHYIEVCRDIHQLSRIGL